jgi:glycosyltransferase involved in cell wall biosynthesis
MEIPPPGRPIRVAFVTSSLGVGGAERLIQGLVQAVSRQRVLPSLVTLYEAGSVGEEILAAGETPFERDLGRSRIDPRIGVRLASALRRLEADVVYTIDSPLPLFWTGLCRRFAPRPRLIVGFHSTGRASNRLQHAIATRTAFGAADRFVALAPSHREFLSRRFAVSPARFTVLPSGVDTNRFTPAADRAAARRAAGLPENGALVGLVAALRPEKNHALFFEVASRLRGAHPDATFLVVGDGERRAQLEGLARERALDRVRFLGSRRDIPEIVRSLDVAVLTSEPVVETLPVTLIEALASGTPVVSTNVGSVADVVSDGETGRLVPAGDAARFAAALGELLLDRPLRERFGRAARADAERRFTLAAMVRGYESMFESVARA